MTDHELSSLLVESFTCPEDPSAFQVVSGLSYVVNCGVGDSNWMTVSGHRKATRLESGQHPLSEQFDWNGDNQVPPNDAEDAEINRDFMLFWPEFQVPENFPENVAKPDSHRVGEIFDGSSNTIMLAENINAGTRLGRKTPSWADLQLSSSGFLLPIDATRVSPSVHGTDGSAQGRRRHGAVSEFDSSRAECFCIPRRIRANAQRRHRHCRPMLD
jgi:hypothetical protein